MFSIARSRQTSELSGLRVDYLLYEREVLRVLLGLLDVLGTVLDQLGAVLLRVLDRLRAVVGPRLDGLRAVFLRVGDRLGAVVLPGRNRLLKS